MDGQEYDHRASGTATETGYFINEVNPSGTSVASTSFVGIIKKER